MRSVPSRLRDCENTDTTGLQPVVFQFQPKEQTAEFLDATDFSRVEVQFLPNSATVEEGRI
jgi:hypothetical protein